MNNKILIASIFSTLMLLIPMTSVVGVSDVEEDCGCQVVNRYDLFRVKLLLVRIKVITNFILLKFGYIPEIKEKCEGILDVINSNRQLDYPIICDILELIYNQIPYIADILQDLIPEYEDDPIIQGIMIIFITYPLSIIVFIIYSLGDTYNCDWYPTL